MHWVGVYWSSFSWFNQLVEAATQKEGANTEARVTTVQRIEATVRINSRWPQKVLEYHMRLAGLESRPRNFR